MRIGNVTFDCSDALTLSALVHEQQEHGISWLTFRDPESNEFCVGEH